jgi:hypothetical protein
MQIMNPSRLLFLFTAAAAASMLGACSGLKIQAPAADAVVTLPAQTHVVVTTSGQGVSNVKVAVDGTDVTGQVPYSPGSGNYVGDLTLAQGVHTVVASADAYCSYCTGQQYQATDSKTFCVASTSPFTSKTMFAQGDALSWSSTSVQSVGVATDTGTPATQWTLAPKGNGLVSIPGTLRSRQFPCYCLRSPNDTNGVAVELAPCDSNDPRQIWDGTREQQSGTVGFYQFRNEGVGAINRGCLAEGNATDKTVGLLVQSDCTGGTNRLWKVRHNTLMQFESDPTPWGR